MPGRLFIERKKQVIQQGKNRCHYCKASLTLVGATVDHIVPIAAGGTNAFYNLVACCWSCNNAKADATDWCSCGRCRYARRRYERMTTQRALL